MTKFDVAAVGDSIVVTVSEKRNLYQLLGSNDKGDF